MNQIKFEEIMHQMLKLQKQSKIIKIALLPILAISWLVGYSLYCIFDGKKMIKTNRNRYEKLTHVNVTITPVIVPKV